MNFDGWFIVGCILGFIVGFVVSALVDVDKAKKHAEEYRAKQEQSEDLGTQEDYVLVDDNE